MMTRNEIKNERIEMENKPLPALHETLTGAKQLIIGSGYRVSASCFENDTVIYACSVESAGRGTFMHPKAEIIFHKDRNTVQTIGF
jgi:hypothetical protein